MKASINIKSGTGFLVLTLSKRNLDELQRQAALDPALKTVALNKRMTTPDGTTILAVVTVQQDEDHYDANGVAA